MKLPVWLIVGMLAGTAALAAAPSATATHAYTCDISDNPTVNETYCVPHCMWDAFTSGQWKTILLCLPSLA